MYDLIKCTQLWVIHKKNEQVKNDCNSHMNASKTNDCVGLQVYATSIDDIST